LLWNHHQLFQFIEIAAIAVGSTLKHSWLCVIGPRILNEAKQGCHIHILAALSCLVAATVGASSLVCGAIPWAN
jgi:hypothetical protein